MKPPRGGAAEGTRSRVLLGALLGEEEFRFARILLSKELICRWRRPDVLRGIAGERNLVREPPSLGGNLPCSAGNFGRAEGGGCRG